MRCSVSVMPLYSVQLSGSDREREQHKPKMLEFKKKNQQKISPGKPPRPNSIQMIR